MPTVEEKLNEDLERAIKAFTQHCYICERKGWVPDLQAEWEHVELPDGRVAVARPKKECEHCGGLGIIVATPEHLGVVNMVLGAVIGLARRSLDDKREYDAHRALTWGVSFMVQNVVNAGATIADAIQMSRDRIENSPLNELLTKPPKVESSSGLSHADLVDLGVVDEDEVG